MKRIVLMVTVAMVMAAMMAVTAMPALAAIHPLARMECANQDQASDVVVNQDPVGLVGQSQGKPPNNPIGGNIAQPIFAVGLNSPQGFENPSFKDEVCPAG
jgi:hypothetical protein